MSLFKKKTNKKQLNEDIEILDLDNEETVTNTLEQRKEFKISIIIGAIAIIFVLLLPKITSLFSKDSIFSYTDKVNEIVNSETIDGMLEIGKEKGYITAKKVKFYNPRKTTDNQISITYLPMSGRNDLNSLNLYIEIYNSNKEVVTRTKFNNSTKLERKVQGTYKLTLNETIYKEAKYFKVTIINDKDFNEINDTLNCKYTFNENNIKVTYERIYNFTKNGLINYKVIRNVEKNDLSNLDETTLQKYIELFKKENENLSKSNITDITLSDTSIEYTINLIEFTTNKSNYQKLYEQGSLKRQIQLSEEKMNWMCE